MHLDMRITFIDNTDHVLLKKKKVGVSILSHIMQIKIEFERETVLRIAFYKENTTLK